MRLKGSTLMFLGAVLVVAAVNQVVWAFPFAQPSLPAFLWAGGCGAAGGFKFGRGIQRRRASYLEAQIRWHASQLHEEIREHLS